MAPKSYGNWVYEKILGSGGFGQVELWKEKYTNKRIAIKRCIIPKTNITPRQLERWTQEIENMKNFKHRNIVKSEPLPAGMNFEPPVLCMEFCNKGDLRKVLNKPKNACGLIQSEALSVMKDVSSALKYLHLKGITHRDLKPENIVLHKNNEVVIYKLIDLGYAKKLSSTTATASLVGTFNYVAPELFQDNRYTCSVDYWSLGILFFEVLTGYKPFIPYTQSLSKWFAHMNGKRYEDICAIDINGDIKFYNCIIYPNDLSKNILDGITEWFQLVLQMNPKKRGKRPNSEEVVVFPLLKKIFPWKTIYVVSVSSYRIDQYNINKNITIIELQQWIEETTSIPISKQIIADSEGTVLNENNNTKILSLEKNSYATLYVYKNDCLEIIESDINRKLPKILDQMFTEPNIINDRSLLRQCYTALIYIMRHEVTLFKQYIFGLGTKLDIIHQRINVLNTKIDKNLPNAELLLNEIKVLLEFVKSDAPGNTDSIRSLFDKSKKLLETITHLKLEVETAEHSSSKIKEFFKSDKLLLLSDLQDFSKLYEDLLCMFQTFEKNKCRNSEYIKDQVDKLLNIIFEFEERKETQLKNQSTTKIIRQLVHLDQKLHSHLKVINSCLVLIKIYKNNLIEFKNKANECTNSNTEMVSNYETSNVNSSLLLIDDRVIRDNIVLNALLEKHLQNIQLRLAEIRL